MPQLGNKECAVLSKKNTLNFDIITLLRQSALDIRGIAAKNPQLLTEEYFTLLKDFTYRSPSVLDALNIISACEGGESDFQSLADIIKLLESIGCNKFIPLFNQIIDAGKKNDAAFAADGAKNVLEDFTIFCRQIMPQEKTDNAETPLNAQYDTGMPGESPPAASYGAHTLKNVLSMLEQIEATRKLRILAVDDAPVILKTIVSVLNDEYKVYTLANPAHLENFLQQITPELFLLDYKMPSLSGFDLIPVIRNFKEHKDTPIIFLTSLGTTDYVSAALALGACDYIVKPINGKILREKTAKHITRKKLF